MLSTHFFGNSRCDINNLFETQQVKQWCYRIDKTNSPYMRNGRVTRDYWFTKRGPSEIKSNLLHLLAGQVRGNSRIERITSEMKFDFVDFAMIVSVVKE